MHNATSNVLILLSMIQVNGGHCISQSIPTKQYNLVNVVHRLDKVNIRKCDVIYGRASVIFVTNYSFAKCRQIKDDAHWRIIIIPPLRTQIFVCLRHTSKILVTTDYWIKKAFLRESVVLKSRAKFAYHKQPQNLFWYIFIKILWAHNIVRQKSVLLIANTIFFFWWDRWISLFASLMFTGLVIRVLLNGVQPCDAFKIPISPSHYCSFGHGKRKENKFIETCYFVHFWPDQLSLFCKLVFFYSKNPNWKPLDTWAGVNFCAHSFFWQMSLGKCHMNLGKWPPT